MDEIEYKLKTNNNILISSAVSKLVEAIKKCSNESKVEECAEFKALQTACVAGDPLLSITACHGMMRLAEDGVLDLKYILSTLMSAVSTSKFYTGIISALGQLLIADMKMRIRNSPDGSYSNQFNIVSPQHPFITVLMKNISTWDDILNQIDHICNDTNEEMSKYSIEFLRPVLLFISLNKSFDLKDTYRQQVWKLLLKQLHRPDVQQVIIEILAWSNVETKTSCHSASVLCIELLDRALLLKNSNIYLRLTPYLVSIMPNLLAFGFDPKPSIVIIFKVLDSGKHPVGINEIVMLLAESIDICPSVYLEDLILFCDAIIEKQPITFIAAHILVSSMIQWMAYSSCLTTSALNLSSKIIQRIKNCKKWSAEPDDKEELLESIKYFSGKLMKTCELSDMANIFHSNISLLDSWIDKLSQIKDHVYLYEIRNFLYGIFICDLKSDLVLKVLKLLLCTVKCYEKMAVGLLTLILFKLSHETDVLIQLELLRALPQMAVVKENIPLIIHTLSSLKKGPISLRCLCIDLQMRLCGIEVRCYPYLQESLVESHTGKGNDWYIDTMKAVAIRELCISRPEHHGSELVAHIARLLNRCVDSKGTVPSSIALDSISHLCRAGVVDVVSTWKALSPRLNNDKRPRVIASLCKLFAIVPSISSDTVEYQNLVEELTIMLWTYITNYDEKLIIDSALDALSFYSSEEMSLKQIPAIFRQNLKLPSSYCKTPQDAARKPEDVLPYIPGECWVQLLQNINHSCMDNAGNLISKWMSIEISQYRSGIYIVPSGKGEPSDCTNLPQKSIVRALIEFVMGQATKSTYDCTPLVLHQCLRVLSKCYAKPLPPFNWCFLHDLYHHSDDLRNYCVTIATRQMVISGSAKRFIENYLNMFDPQEHNAEEIINLYENLPYYCKFIAPNTIRKVIGTTLDLSLENALSSQEDVKGDLLFKELMKRIQQTLNAPDIHDANRTLLAQLMEQLFDKIHHDDELFQCFAECCLELPILYFDRMTSPSNWWESSAAKVRKATIIRCAMARKTFNDNKALIWLNEIIDIGMTEVYEQNYILSKIIPIIQSRHSSKFVSSNSEWCLELMGQTQAELVKLNESKSSATIHQNSITFMCDVLMLTLECLSGVACLKIDSLKEFVSSTAKFDLFPIAVEALSTDKDWSSTIVQVIEWLYHMNLSSIIPNMYKVAFQKAIVILKTHEHFEQKSLWFKIIHENYIKVL